MPSYSYEDYVRFGETAQPAALEEDRGSSPSNHSGSPPSIAPVPGHPLPPALDIHIRHTHTRRQNTHGHKINKPKKKRFRKNLSKHGRKCFQWNLPSETGRRWTSQKPRLWLHSANTHWGESRGHTPEGRVILLECGMTDSSHLPPSPTSWSGDISIIFKVLLFNNGVLLVCVFLFCLRRLYENDSQEIKTCKPTNMVGGGGTREKDLMVGKFQNVLGGKEPVERMVTDTAELWKGRPESPGRVVIKVKYVTCGQDRRLLFWETRLTHCVCPQAETPKSALASFLPTAQGPLCWTSLASTLEQPESWLLFGKVCERLE